MELLKTIKEQDINPNTNINSEVTYSQRDAARAVVFDNDNNIALLHVTKKNYHKLPGGGVEKAEDMIKALKRECLEEIGSVIVTSKEVGEIIEFRDVFKLRQTSHCYLAKVIGNKGHPSFTAKELSGGFEVIWAPLNKAIEIINKDQPNDYEGKFVTLRDLIFLQKAKTLV